MDEEKDEKRLEAEAVPREIRHRALAMADVAVRQVLHETGFPLDFFGRLALIEIALDDTEEDLTPRVN